MDIKKPQLVKVEAFAYFFCREFCNTLRTDSELFFRSES